MPASKAASLIGAELSIPGFADPPWLAWRTETPDDDGASFDTEGRAIP